MIKTETLREVRAEELDASLKEKLRDFMARCEAHGLYCSLSSDGTRIVFFADQEKTKRMEDIPLSLYHKLHLANM